MTSADPAAPHPGVQPAHPGAVLREEVFPALGLGVSEAAARLGISRQALHNVLTERAAVSVEMAVRLSRLLGSDPILWLGMQNAHDVWEQGRTLAGVLADITPAQRHPV